MRGDEEEDWGEYVRACSCPVLPLCKFWQRNIEEEWEKKHEGRNMGQTTPY